MSTWISKGCLALAALLALSGCLGEAEANLVERAAQPTSKPAVKAAPAIRKVTLAEGTVVVEAPSGYCIDNRTTQDRRRGAFVLMAACASVTGDPNAILPLGLNLLTITIGREGSGGDLGPTQGVADFFTSPSGRALLSREGKAETVTVDRSYTRNGAVFLALTDTSAKRPGGVDEHSWRAIFPMDGRLITVGVLALEDGGTTDAEGLDLAAEMVARLRRSNLEKLTGAADTGLRD